jgi:predicted dehydrogenase
VDENPKAAEARMPAVAEGRSLRIAAIGAGYVAPSQLRAWQGVWDVELVGICDTDIARAKTAAEEFGIPAVFGDARKMLDALDVDAVDILTTPDSHRELVSIAAASGRHVLCQKPLSTSLADAEAIVAECDKRGVRLMINENFRWRASFRWAKAEIERGTIGRVFYASFNGRFNVTRPSVEWPGGRLFTLRPYFRDVDQLIILENTLHWIDVSRFLFGEPEAVFCTTQRSSDLGRGEDTTVIVLPSEERTVVIQNAWGSYGYPYPAAEALVAIEGTQGTLFIDRDGRGSVASPDGTLGEASYDVESYVLDSFCATQRHFADCLRSGRPFETSGADNLKTYRLAVRAYDAARRRQVVEVDGVTA